jgi:hypothetical protein
MHKIIAALLLALLLHSAPARAESLPPRDPFKQTEAITNPYQYAQAIQQVVVMGIVMAGKVERVIVRINGYDELAVFKGGDTIAVNFQGLPHEFKIMEVNPRSVSFEAGPKHSKKGKDPDTFTYEVFLL